jgi:NDP-4-keto-2,6-dideoxyhexose 3-C-methyltransferase
MSYTTLTRCRICGNPQLEQVLDLGEQTLTGVFPKTLNQKITKGPLRLVKCVGGDQACGLLQLAHSYDLEEMYGENYGYRSGLNASMVKHLHAKVERILSKIDFTEHPLVLDIGSNDGTTLAAYPADRCERVGMDPTSDKFRQYHPPGINAIADFFSAQTFLTYYPGRKARVVTSLSMFYDLEQPMTFVKEVAQILDEKGVWVFEQSYMPLMLKTNSYDTACHEHLEYYALKQIQWMLSRAGLKIVDVEFNDVNGGSFSVMAAHLSSSIPEFSQLPQLLEEEAYLDDLSTYKAFAKRVEQTRRELLEFLRTAKAQGKRVAALGASTKGNVLLQYCGLEAEYVEAVGEVNPDKFGVYTPGTLLPIVDEKQILAHEPDYLLVLPWHFKPFFLQRYKLQKAKLVFPLPNLQIV